MPTLAESGPTTATEMSQDVRDALSVLLHCTGILNAKGSIIGEAQRRALRLSMRDAAQSLASLTGTRNEAVSPPPSARPQPPPASDISLRD